ncbi:RNA pseudouridine synthase [bacterium]|nr:RNA pseudouridine synthase [bacterium]
MVRHDALDQAFGGGDQKPVFLLKSGLFTIPVIAETDDYLVVDKPAGLVVYQPHSAHGPSLVEAARSYIDIEDGERAGVVHRLDKETSGIMLLARTEASQRYLSKLFKDRTIEKHYLALVQGCLKQPQARLELPIKRSLRRPTTMMIHPSGRTAISEYSVLGEYAGNSLVDVRILTGRTHQIRVQLAYIGHPVVGDTVYGNARRPAGLSQQFLHASRLSFTDRVGHEVQYQSSLPQPLQTYLEQQA